jgi:chromosome segregation ATPase
MEALTVPTDRGDSWSEELTAALKVQRARTREFLATQHARLRRAEEELTSQLQRLAEDAAGKERQQQRIHEDLDARAEALRQQTESLERLKTDLSERQSAWQKLQEQAQAQWEVWRQQLARCEEEFERRRVQWEQTAATEQAELQRQSDQRRQRIEELESELSVARQEAAGQAAEAEQAQERCGKLEEAAAQIRSQGDQSSDETAQFRRERDELARQLDEAQSQLTYATGQLAAAEPSSRVEEESYHRRYQMALDDLKEMKAKNAELEQELVRRQAVDAPKAVSEVRGKFQDWETEKQRILAALEADFDADNEVTQEERLKVEEVIRTTEGLMADKDREIEELKHLLEHQSGHLGTMAVGAAALGEVLDQDALIREAREELKNLQDQMREKMRQAEVEVSVERAKLARQRQDLEEKARFMEKYVPAEPGETPAPQKPVRGKWLERLGLKETEK